MSLVSYEFSDSEGENSDTDIGEKNTVKVAEVQLHSNTSFFETPPHVLFSSLPLPKMGLLTSKEEETDVFLKKTTQVVDKKVIKKEIVKIACPSLVEYNSDEEVPKKILKPVTLTKATGLFAVLPPPKAVKENITFIPKSVKTKMLKVNKPQFTEDSGDENEAASPKEHFFTSLFTTDAVNLTESNELTESVNGTDDNHLINMPVDSARPVCNVDSKTNEYYVELFANKSNLSNRTMDPNADSDQCLDDQAYKELCGRKRNSKGKQKENDVKIINIDASEIMPDHRDWMTKALTEEQPNTSVRKGDEPSLQHRRKHQITYLAYQAKVNEQDLKNQWSMNRMTRKQTQAKYGF